MTRDLECLPVAREGLCVLEAMESQGGSEALALSWGPHIRGAIKEVMLSQGTGAIGRGWLACLEVAPFRAWTGGPSTVRSQLRVLRSPLPSLGNGIRISGFQTSGAVMGRRVGRLRKWGSVPPLPPLLCSPEVCYLI